MILAASRSVRNRTFIVLCGVAPWHSLGAYIYFGWIPALIVLLAYGLVLVAIHKRWRFPDDPC